LISGQIAPCQRGAGGEVSRPRYQVVVTEVVSGGGDGSLNRVSFSSTAPPLFFNVHMTLLQAEKAAAPRAFFVHWETLRAMTAGRSACSAAWLVGATVVGAGRNHSRLPRA